MLWPSAEIKFLHYSCGYWEFPKVDCTKIIETKFTFMEAMNSNGSFQKKGYKFKEEESVKKVQKFKKYVKYLFMT